VVDGLIVEFLEGPVAGANVVERARLFDRVARAGGLVSPKRPRRWGRMERTSKRRRKERA
jgi:hypothetical protein